MNDKYKRIIEMSALPLMLLFLSAVALTFQSCKGKSKSNNLSAATDSLSDDALMDTVQRRTFLYFWEGAEPNSGLAPERYHVDGVYPENDANVVTSGGRTLVMKGCWWEGNRLCVAIGETTFTSSELSFSGFENSIGDNGNLRFTVAKYGRTLFVYDKDGALRIWFDESGIHTASGVLRSRRRQRGGYRALRQRRHHRVERRLESRRSLRLRFERRLHVRNRNRRLLRDRVGTARGQRLRQGLDRQNRG